MVAAGIFVGGSEREEELDEAAALMLEMSIMAGSLTLAYEHRQIKKGTVRR